MLSVEMLSGTSPDSTASSSMAASSDRLVLHACIWEPSSSSGSASSASLYALARACDVRLMCFSSALLRPHSSEIFCPHRSSRLRPLQALW